MTHFLFSVAATLQPKVHAQLRVVKRPACTAAQFAVDCVQLAVVPCPDNMRDNTLGRLTTRSA